MSYDKPKPFQFQSKALKEDTFVVAAVEGEEAISRPFRFTLDLLSKNASIKLEDVVRNPATMPIRQPVPVKGSAKKGLKTYPMHGMVASIEQLDKLQDWVRYRAVFVPRLWRLSLNVRSRIFLDLSIPDVVKEVLKGEGCGFTTDDFEFKLSGSYPKHEYVVQYQESDLDFVSRWLEHEGIYYFFEHSEQGDKVVFADSTAPYPRMPGDAALPYRPQQSSSARAPSPGDDEEALEEAVRALALRVTDQPGTVVLKDWNYRAPAGDMKVKNVFESKDPEIHYEYGAHYKNKKEGEQIAKARAEAFQCRQKVIEGASDCRLLRAGLRFTLSEHYRSDANAAYVVTSVRHRARQESQGSGADAGAAYTNAFQCIPATLTYRPERRTPWPRVPGFLNAVVDAGGDGKYAEIDDQGRYKVKFPFDLSDEKDGKASRAVRKGEVYGGNGMGMHFPLHKGTEVLIAHEQGNPDRPLIVATAPNPDTQSMVTSANQTQCDLKSGGNNEIRFEDQEGSEQVYVHAQKDQLVVIENDHTLQVKHDQKIEVTNDRVKTVTGNQTESVTKDKKITVTGSHTESVTKDITISGAANKSESIAQNVTLAVGANVNETIGASRAQAVAASDAVTIGATRSLTVGGAEQRTIGGASNETIGGAKAVEVGGASSEAVGGAKQVAVGGDCGETFGGNHNETTNKSFSLLVKEKIAVEAKGDSVSIVCGKSKIVLKKDGTVLIEGKDVQIKASGALEAKASKDLTLKGKNILEN